MTLITGDELQSDKFFISGNPIQRASGFDLRIGTIVDQHGEQSVGPFILKPGHMVQVISKEIFQLPPTITGHVTYKTALTKKGIWALTVGIVDPGWNGPIATTLLNFSRVDCALNSGDTFLRVILFKHKAVDKSLLPKCPTPSEYLKEIQSSAATIFPTTFLNASDIATKAGNSVLKRIRSEGIAWLAAIAIIFTILQLLVSIAPPIIAPSIFGATTMGEIDALKSKVTELETKIDRLEGR